jgi:hypothetical protein
MNPAYKQTFLRHKVLLSVPIAVTTVLALWFAFGTAKQYRASASIWADANPPGASSVSPSSGPTSFAIQTQQALSELLISKRFRLEVARRGPVAAYAAAHPTQGWGPQAVLQKIRGSGSAEDRAAAALDFRHVTLIVDGPHLVTMQLNGPTPEVAVGTLQALIDSFGDELDQLAVKRQEDAMAHFAEQRDGAAEALTDLQEQINLLQQSPNGSAELPGLIKARQLGQKRLTKATLAYNRAKLNAMTGGGQKDTFRVQDPAEPPAPPVGGMKKSLMVVFAGLFAGALLSFLGLVLLTRDGETGDEAGLGDGRSPAREAVSMGTVGEGSSPGERRPTTKAAGGGRFRR